MQDNQWRCVGVALAALGLAGCGANHNSIYRQHSLTTDAPSVITMDAKQRVLLSAPVPGGSVPPPAGGAGAGERAQRMRFCLEGSPDVFSVLAQAASGTGSFGQTADPKAVQAAASFAYSSAEQGSTIARTQTVNMLREIMFRTCERYMNGDLSDLEMPIREVRDQRLTVAIMAIEGLTGVARSQAIAIGASGGAQAGASNQEATVRVDDAYKAYQAANAAAAEKQKALDKLDEAAPTCKAVKTKVDAGTALDAAETTKKADCEKAAAALKAAADDRDAKSAHYKALQAAATRAGAGPASAETSIQTPVIGAAVAGPSGDVLATVAKTVEAIVLANYDQDEFLLLCLKILPEQDPKDLVPVCSSYVQEGIRREAVKVQADAARLAAEKAQFDLEFRQAFTETRKDQLTHFDKFWAKIEQPGSASLANEGELRKVVDAYLKAHPKTSSKTLLQALRGADNRNEALLIFRQLQTRTQELLGS